MIKKKMMRAGFFILFSLLSALTFFSEGQAQTINSPKLTLDLASDHIDITTGFNGAPLYIYGVVENLPDGGKETAAPPDIAIVVKGPMKTVIVRRKEQFLGMWMNLKAVEFDEVYSFYDLATTRALASFSDTKAMAEKDIGLNYLDFEPAGLSRSAQKNRIATFREALIARKQSAGLYAFNEKEIIFSRPGFFKTVFDIPPNVPTGQYTVEGYLFENDELIDSDERELKVAQIGMNAEIFKFAYQQTFLYGLTAVLLALVMGWAAHAFLRND